MQISQQSSPNFLIRSFAPELFARLEPSLERVNLELGQELVPPDKEATHAFFPEGGVCSIVVLSRSEEIPTEVGLFGREGVSSLSALLGAGATASSTTVQVNGHTTLRIEVAQLREEMDRDRTLLALMLKYVHVMMHQLAMNAAAYSHHQLEARLSRWLLMCHDRLDGDTVGLTHEFMSQMLGSRRSSVTVTLHVLEGMGAIRSERGVVHIRDRAKLEDLAGETYGSAEREYSRLIGDFTTAA